MVRKIALTAAPLSGKSTLAKYLEKEYGFIRADHSRTLVQAFVDNWNSPLPHVEQITVDQVYRKKETWRPLLQTFGDMIGYNDPSKATYWIMKTMDAAVVEGMKGMVFDSFRGETQAATLRDMGFTLVQIEITEAERLDRAMSLGLDYEKLLESMNARPDLESGIRQPDITLSGEQPVDLMARILLAYVGKSEKEIVDVPKRG